MSLKQWIFYECYRFVDQQCCQTALNSGLIKVVVVAVFKVNVYVTNKKNKSCEVAYLVKKVRQLFSKHRVSKIVSPVGWRTIPAEKSVVYCAA